MKSAGYTLVELLVVVAIISVLGGIIILNVGKFQQDGLTNKTLIELQSKLSLIQAKASSNQKCSSSPSLSSTLWYGKLSKSGDNFQILTYCVGVDPDHSESLADTFTIDSIFTLTACIPGLTDKNCTADSIICKTSSSDILQVTFDSLSGAVKFFSPTNPCLSNGSKVFIDLTNTKTATIKTLMIDKGGVIDKIE